MFGKKEKGTSVMHFEGLPGFQQNMPCFINMDESNLLFTTKAGGSVTLPLAKIEHIDIMPELDYMQRYHNTGTTTAKVGVKWFAAICYTGGAGPARIGVWYVDLKASKLLYAIQERCTGSGGITL